MKKTIIISILLFAAALMSGCDNSSDRPITSGGGQGGGPQINTNVDSEVNFLKGVVRDDPKNVSAWIKLGNTTMDAQRFAEAIEAYGKALELDPNNVNVIVDQGTCYRRMGRSDVAAKLYRQGIAINPKHLNAHKNLGVVLGYDLNDYAGAIKEFQTYLDLAPGAQDRDQIEGIISEMKQAQAANPSSGR